MSAGQKNPSRKKAGRIWKETGSGLGKIRFPVGEDGRGPQQGQATPGAAPGG